VTSTKDGVIAVRKKPVVVRSDEGTSYDFGDVSTIRVRLTADDSDGLLTVFEVEGDLERDPSEVRQHLHDDFTEIFYILEGEVDLVSGDDDPVLGLSPGSLIVVPPGVPHGLAPYGRWRHVTFVLPGGFDRYFAEVAAALADGGDTADRAAIAARHGTHPA
jgi:mannose-6-phosphate isomerase-like protein (cupin superfamily)